MVCVHLKELYDLCLAHQLKLGGSDLIRIICTQCNKHDVCPSTIHEEGDAAPEREETPHAVGVPQDISLAAPTPGRG